MPVAERGGPSSSSVRSYSSSVTAAHVADLELAAGVAAGHVHDGARLAAHRGIGPDRRAQTARAVAQLDVQPLPAARPIADQQDLVDLLSLNELPHQHVQNARGAPGRNSRRGGSVSRRRSGSPGRRARGCCARWRRR